MKKTEEGASRKPSVVRAKPDKHHRTPPEAMAEFLAQPTEANPEYDAAWLEAAEVSAIDDEIEQHRQFKQAAKSSAESDYSDMRVDELLKRRDLLLWPEGRDSEVFKSVSVVHTTRSKKRDAMSPVIELAQRACCDPQDAAEVWAKLLVLAEKKEPPLLGSAKEGLQYLDHEEGAKFLSKDALAKRLKRQK